MSVAKLSFAVKGGQIAVAVATVNVVHAVGGGKWGEKRVFREIRSAPQTISLP